MNSFWHAITSNFNNREISLLIWLLIVFMLAFAKERIKMLKTSWGVISLLFGKKLLIVQLTFWAYLSGVILLLWSLGLWNSSMMKDSIIFILISALLLGLKIGTNKNPNKSLKEIFADAVKPVIFVEFVLNLESLSLISELVLLPIMLVLYYGAYTYRNKQGEEKIATGFNVLLSLFTLYLLFHGMHYLYTNFDTIDQQQTLRNFLFPVLTTIAFLPCLYGMIKYMNWEDNRVNKRIRDMYNRKREPFS